MAYDLHIVRTKDWLNAEDHPITKGDVDQLVTADPELAWSTTDWIDLRVGRKTVPTRFFMILWNDAPCFWWYLNEIRCDGPSAEQVGKMVEMAEDLKAHVIGDDGAEYRPNSWQATYRGES